MVWSFPLEPPLYCGAPYLRPRLGSIKNEAHETGVRRSDRRGGVTSQWQSERTLPCTPVTGRGRGTRRVCGVGARPANTKPCGPASHVGMQTAPVMSARSHFRRPRSVSTTQLRVAVAVGERWERGPALCIQLARPETPRPPAHKGRVRSGRRRRPRIKTSRLKNAGDPGSPSLA